MPVPTPSVMAMQASTNPLLVIIHKPGTDEVVLVEH